MFGHFKEVMEEIVMDHSREKYRLGFLLLGFNVVLSVCMLT
jgi:hypothetical protein